MVYLPTFTIKINHWYVNIPYINPMGLCHVMKRKFSTHLITCGILPFFGGFNGSFACVQSIPWEISGLLTRFWASGSKKSHVLFAQWGGPSTSPAPVVCWISEQINFEEGGMIKGILPMIYFFLFGDIWISILHTPYKRLIKTTIASGLEQLTPTIYRTIEK